MPMEFNTIVASQSKTTFSNYPPDERMLGEGDPYQLFQEEVKVTKSSNYPLDERVLRAGDPYQLFQEVVKVEHEDNANKRVVRTVKLTNPWKTKNKNVEMPGNRKHLFSQSSSHLIIGENPTDHENLDDPDDPDDPDKLETQHHIRSNHEIKLLRSLKTSQKNTLGKTKLHYKTQEMQSYSRSEDIHILNFLIKGSFFKLTKGDMIWKHMKEQGLNPNRSWKGLKTRFLGSILKNLEKYGLTRHMILMSDRTPMGEKFLLPQPLDGDGDVVKVIKPFSMEDDKKIIQYIIKNNKFSHLMGSKMWKEMENCGVVPKRSWSGLMERFKKVIFPNIEAYNFNKSDLSKFHDVKETRLKVNLINQNNKQIDTNLDHTSATCSVNLDKELLNSKIQSLFHRPEIPKHGLNIEIGEKKSKYVCHVCGHTARHESSTINHVTIHIKELIYSCSKCAYTAKTRDYMNNHIRKLSKETQKAYNNIINPVPSKFKCNLCHIRFASAIEQQTHFIEQPIYCKDCSKCHDSDTENWPAEDQCAKHNLFFRCLKCFFLGKTETGLNMHMARKHKESKNSNRGVTSMKLT